jgi:alpha-N-arabinofuranosidase
MNGSASRKGNIVTLTVVNPDATNPQLTQIAVRGARVSSASAIILTASDKHAHNTFEHPDAVKPVKLDTSVYSDHVIATLAPASVSKVEIVLGA